MLCCLYQRAKAKINNDLSSLHSRAKRHLFSATFLWTQGGGGMDENLQWWRWYKFLLWTPHGFMAIKSFVSKVMRDQDGLMIRDGQGKVIITQVLSHFTNTFTFWKFSGTGDNIDKYFQVFPVVSKEFAFYYKLLYYTILETVVKLVLPLAILIYTNLSIYRLVNKENPFVSSWSC